MLHSEVDQDWIFDFVFLNDGISVEDPALFEGNGMITRLIIVAGRARRGKRDGPVQTGRGLPFPSVLLASA